jgi:thioredoxin-related protein
MNKLPIFATIILAFVLMAASPRGINFHQEGWAKTSSFAKDQGKPIFVFVRTQTCMRSARMDDVFKQKEVADFFNANFVSLQLDPDKPMDNLRVTNWGAQGVPTFVFFDAEKNKVHMIKGERGAIDIVKEAEKALKMAGIKDYTKPGKITQTTKNSSTEVIIEDDGSDEDDE